jgi:hypothetical protein
MSDKAQPVQCGTGSQPETHRLKAGASGLMPSLKNLAQAATGVEVANDHQTSQKRPRDVRLIFVSL